MNMIGRIAGIGFAATLALNTSVVCAQSKADDAGDYPSKMVRIIVGYSAGGGTDAVGRLFAQRFGETMNQQFIVENRPGAGGNIAAEYVARSNDPYKLLFGAGAHVINASLYSKIPYDPIKDFSPISLIAVAPNVLVANPALGVKDLRELIEIARSKPGRVSYASPGSGTPMHLAMELFASMAGIKLVHVPYSGGGTAVAAALGGQTDLLTMSLPTVLPHIKSGKLVPLGVTSRTRSALMPEMPTVEESAGLPGYEAIAWYGLLGPAGMPPAAVNKLNSAIEQELRNPDVKQKLVAQGFEPSRNSPADFRRFLIDDMNKWAKVVKESGAKAD